MIEFEFNGASHQAQPETTVRGLLDSAKIESRFCAVKSQYDTYRVQPGDRIEVVTLVGGG